jgi:hypothetical protein
MIAFVQSADSGTPVGSATSVSKAFVSLQTAGNLNVVVINLGKNSGTFTETIASVTDTQGNIYYPATSLDRMTDGGGNGDGLIIYYSPNIYSGSNTITVATSSAVDFFAISILEYSGIGLLNPLDVTSSVILNGLHVSTSASTGFINTTNANDLVIGAFCLFNGPSSSDPDYSVRSNFYTILVQDKIVSSIGSYTSTAVSLNDSGWIGQIVSFKDTSASVSTDYAIISGDESSVLTVMTMTPSLKANMLENNPQLILLPVNMTAKPSFTPATQTVIQSGWIIGSVDVQPKWIVISQTSDQMVVSTAQRYYDSVTIGLVDSFTSALSSWGTQNSTTKDALLVNLIDSVNAILQCKFGLQLPFRLSLSGFMGITGALQLNELFLSLNGAAGITGLSSMQLNLHLAGFITLSGQIADPMI